MANVKKIWLGKRVGWVGVALTTYDLWRRLPPEYRKRAIRLARTHGPPLARLVRDQYYEYRRKKLKP
jgi:hypothetical protein